jgi:hypothetical protein
MANLLETIRNNRGSEQPQMNDESQRLAGLLRAKSGRAVSSPEVGASAVQEQAAVDNTRTQLQGVGAADNFIQQGLAQQSRNIQQNETQALSEVSQSRRFDDLQTRIKTDQMLSELERNKGKQDLDQEKAQMEQIGFQLRLQNTQYVDNLQREGNRARLDDGINFNQELKREVFGENEKLLNEGYANKNILDGNDRDFARAMAKMQLKTAWDMFDNEMKAMKKAQRWNALTGGVSAIAGGMGGGGASSAPSSANTVQDTPTGNYGSTSSTTSRTV